MPKYSVKLVITIILIENCINQNFSRCKEKHENKVVDIGVRHGPTKATFKHIGGQNQKSHKRSVEEGLCSFGYSHLDLVTMLEQQVADS